MSKIKKSGTDCAHTYQKTHDTKTGEPHMQCTNCQDIKPYEKPIGILGGYSPTFLDNEVKELFDGKDFRGDGRRERAVILRAMVALNKRLIRLEEALG